MTQGAFPFVSQPLNAAAMSAARRCLLHAYAAKWLGLEPALRSRAGNSEVGSGEAQQPAPAAVLPAAGKNQKSGLDSLSGRNHHIAK